MEAFISKTGIRGTPVIEIDGEFVRGFDRGKVERLLNLSSREA